MQLNDWLREQEISQETFGQWLSPFVKQASVSHWANGRHLPPLDYADQIQRMTKDAVTLSDFLAANRDFRARTEAAKEAA